MIGSGRRPVPCCAAAASISTARKTMPYSSYEKFDFKVPVATESDVFARYMCRLQEMRRERRNRPAGAGGHARRTDQGRCAELVLPDREKMKTQMEALIYHFKIVTEGFRVPAGEVYRRSNRRAARSATTSSATERRNRIACTCARPSFGNLQGVPKMIEGHADRGRDCGDWKHGYRAGRY